MSVIDSFSKPLRALTAAAMLLPGAAGCCGPSSYQKDTTTQEERIEIADRAAAAERAAVAHQARETAKDLHQPIEELAPPPQTPEPSFAELFNRDLQPSMSDKEHILELLKPLRAITESHEELLVLEQDELSKMIKDETRSTGFRSTAVQLLILNQKILNGLQIPLAKDQD